jgi:hypothetical protein
LPRPLTCGNAGQCSSQWEPPERHHLETGRSACLEQSAAEVTIARSTPRANQDREGVHTNAAGGTEKQGHSNSDDRTASRQRRCVCRHHGGWSPALRSRSPPLHLDRTQCAGRSCCGAFCVPAPSRCSRALNKLRLRLLRLPPLGSGLTRVSHASSTKNPWAIRMSSGLLSPYFLPTFSRDDRASSPARWWLLGGS